MRIPLSCLALTLSLPLVANAQPDLSKVEITSAKLAEGLHVLFGAGGNIGVSSGKDGVFLIDDQYAPMTAKIRAAVAQITDKPIRFVLNTHWHGDHTGGNVDGMIGAADRVLEMANDATQIIPGHGPMAKKAELKAFRDMLAGVRDKMKPLITAGKTLAEVQAAKPTQAFDEKWGKGFLKPEQFVAVAYAALGGKKK